jgi:hypothetical protein
MGMLGFWDDDVRQNISRALTTMALAFVVMNPQAAVAQVRAFRALRSLSVNVRSDGWDLDLRFESSIRYLRHAPTDKGQLLRILVDPLQLGSLAQPANPRKEILPLPNLKGAPIVEIAYDASARNERFVEIQFSRAVSFDVTQGEDFQSVKIRVRDRPSVIARPKKDTNDGSKSAQLLGRAKRALRDRELPLAISLLTKILETQDAKASTETRREAKELLGLAHERAGQEAHARAEYESYLADYPDGAPSDRVRQRLDSLITAASAPRTPLKSATRKSSDARWGTLDYDVFGSLALTYFRAEPIDPDVGDNFLASDILADFDLASRISDDDWEVQTDFTGTYDVDIAGQGRSDDLRVSRLSVEFEDRSHGYAVTIGRQRRSDSGVLGRFDGLHGSYRFASKYTLSALVGLPVTSTSDRAPDTDSILAGGALDVDDLWIKGLGVQLFIIGQNTDSMMDRTAIGGDIRYSNRSTYSYVYLDYDMLFNSLNTAIVSNTYYWRPDTDFRFLVDRRNSPVLTLGTALQAQPFSDLDELRDSLSDSEIRDLVLDRTFVFWSGTIGVTHRPVKDLQISGDLGVAYNEATNLSLAEGGVGATGPDFNLSLQLLTNDWLVEGGVESISMRYFEGETSRAVGVSLFGRYLLLDGFSLTPRLRWDWRDSDFLGGTSTLRPSLESEWRYGDFILHADAGIQWLEPLSAEFLESETSYYVEIGLRWQF